MKIDPEIHQRRTIRLKGYEKNPVNIIKKQKGQAGKVEMRKEERLLKKFFEFFVRKTGIFDNGLEGVGIEPVVVRDGYAVSSIGHADVFSTGYDLEADFAEGPDSPLSRDIGEDHLRREPLPDIPSNPLFPLLSYGGKC